MRIPDLLQLTGGAIRAQRARSLLTGLGIAIGIAAVVLLTGLGRGLQGFVVAEFSQFGTNILAVTPGKTGTFGISGAVANTVRPLSLEDAESLRTLPGVQGMVPLVQGNAAVEGGGRNRRAMVFGVSGDVPQVWQMKTALGQFLPSGDGDRSRALAVLGSKLREELFGDRSPLGERIRIGGESFRVIGVMAPKGQLLGFDLDDSVYIPTARAMAAFDREGMMEVDLLYRPGVRTDRIVSSVRQRLVQRHGDEDFTITTQDQMLEVLGSVMDILTAAVAALGAISLLVGAVGIVTIMTIAVNERVGEIGLLRALGASQWQISGLFLGEAVLLASAGGLAGLSAGVLLTWLIGATATDLPAAVDWGYAFAALLVSAIIGLVAGVLPARRAGRLDPIEALRAE